VTTYDPRRSRPTPKVVPDEESAPIDVLLGPDPAEEPTADTLVSDVGPTPGPAPVRRVERAPSALLQLAPALLAALAVVLVWLVRRSRR